MNLCLTMQVYVLCWLGGKFFTFTGVIDSKMLWKKGKSNKMYYEIIGYQTRSRRLFAEIKEINNKKVTESKLKELSYLWEVFRSPKFGDFGYIYPTDKFDYPQEFLYGMREAIRNEEGLYNYMVID